MPRGSKNKVKIGDVFVIPLPNGKYAFGRRFRDASIAIYKKLGEIIEDLPDNEEYQFIVGVYNDVLTSGNWPIVANRPFQSEEEAWPPPSCIIDPVNGKCSLYYKGQITDASKDECEGLEIAAVWEAEHIIDRIMGEDKWHRR